MDFILIVGLQIIGVGFHVGQKIRDLRVKFPNKKIPEVFGVFWQQDWNTLLGSALVLAFDMMVHFIIMEYLPAIAAHEYFEVISFGVAFVLGYAGQRIIYKHLGTAESFINSQIERRIGK